MDFENVKSGLASGNFILIDVRNLNELTAQGKIPGSFHLPLTEMDEALKLSSEDFKDKYKFEKPSSDNKYVTHCKMGGRALKAAEKLKSELGIEADVYKGSFDDWSEQGGEIQMV